RRCSRSRRASTPHARSRRLGSPAGGGNPTVRRAPSLSTSPGSDHLQDARARACRGPPPLLRPAPARAPPPPSLTAFWSSARTVAALHRPEAGEPELDRVEGLGADHGVALERVDEDPSTGVEPVDLERPQERIHEPHVTDPLAPVDA